MAFGIAFSIKSNLGTSPISSLPYAASEITGLTVGVATITMHVAFIALQIILLRRAYQIFQLSQLIVAFVFGAFIDIAMFCLQDLVATNYIEQWLCCLIGILLVGVGVSLEVAARFAIVAGEGLVLAICDVFHTHFGNTKVGFDVTLVALSVILSLSFLGTVVGVREGTLAAGLLVGQVAKFCLQHTQKLGSWLNS